ncbi:PAPLN [Cordylochernes scorpioides]|uniref:PAPLN n=1 Tax=Cordylochernes scorpioides TaxID=51811 RepID=A0ABY6L1U5_9ARAC|nr:PAPLN [Cordylochernes scorpioides]
MILSTVLFVLSCVILEAQGRAFYCYEEVRPGPCKGNFKRFFFNQTSAKCEAFVYGGCNGNLNRFQTLDECEEDCHAGPRVGNHADAVATEGFQPQHCGDTPDSGPCRGLFKRYYYNNKTDSCQEFVFGGCGGNRNNFRQLEDCQHECKRRAASVSREVCALPPFSGPCLAYIPRYHYDPVTQTCKQFVYGGCQSNGNNFRSEAECLSSCRAEEKEAAPSEELCSLPPETGRCRGYFPRYHYDPKSNTCRRFIYGGCGGNDNNFKTEAECTKSCGEKLVVFPAVALSEDDTPICRRPKKVGDCKAAIPRFYFDRNTKTCKEFTWGGCDSNGNNFHNHEECMTACEVLRPSSCHAPYKSPMSTGEIPVCERPPQTGMCRGNFPMFYYDPKTRSCKEFVYGGCGSNGNNFGTVEECLEACDAGVTAAPKLCSLPPVTGMCRGLFRRFHYDSKSKTCQLFIYGGCKGNANNFRTKAQCTKTCGGETVLRLRCLLNQTPPRQSTHILEVNVFHFTQYDPPHGPLRAFLRYPRRQGYYSNSSEKKAFHHGLGLWPFSVQYRFKIMRFVSELVHGVPHGVVSAGVTAAPELCSLPPETGMCRGYFPRYHYDPSSNTCRRFIYGGCGGNSNNFQTEAECTKTCGSKDPQLVSVCLDTSNDFLF